MRVAGAEIIAIRNPEHGDPHGVRLSIVDDNRSGHRNSCRGSGMYFRSTKGVLAAISELRACLPIVDQLGTVADD